MAKSWTEKLHTKNPPQVVKLDRPMMGLPVGTRLYIATPLIVREFISKIPEGQTMSVPEIRDELAKANGADVACPLTTGIFLRIVAEHALEEMNAGKPASEVAPFWRAIDPKSSLAKKLSGGPDLIQRLRKTEGT
jgi:hypothetical protein